MALGLLAAAGPSATPMSFGQRLYGAMQQDQARRTEAEDRKMRQQMQQLQMQQLLAQAAEQKRMRENEDKFRGMISSPQMDASQAALAGGGGPTVANAAQMKPVDPMQQLQFEAMRLGQIKPLDYINAQRKDTTPIKIGRDDRLVQPGTNKVLVDALPKEASDTADLKNWLAVKSQGYPHDFNTFLREQANLKAPKTSLQINTDNLGLKPKDRFEMEQKLAGDYTAATKLDRGIVTTAQDITNILKQGGALKDQAAIYKFAKALDPDGAVREADYAAIVQTAGGIGYVQALFNKALTGEQLLPRQRQEMINITQSMANVAQKRIENQRSSLSRNARQYNLTPENIFAPTETLSPTEGLGAVDLQSAAAAELKRRRGGN